MNGQELNFLLKVRKMTILIEREDELISEGSSNPLALFALD